MTSSAGGDAVLQTLATFVDGMVRQAVEELPKLEHPASKKELEQMVAQSGAWDEFISSLGADENMKIREEDEGEIQSAFLQACADGYEASRVWAELPQADQPWVEHRLWNQHEARRRLESISEAVRDQVDEWIFSLSWRVAEKVVGVAEDAESDSGSEESEESEEHSASESDGEAPDEEARSDGSCTPPPSSKRRRSASEPRSEE
jgi:hypothetical protein